MQNLLRASALLCVIALLAWAQTPVSAGDAKDGEWAKGWNTWKTTQKGDWVEYSIGGEVGYKDEVSEAKDGKITYSHTMLDKQGKETSKKEFTKDWSSIRLQGKLPYASDNPVVWKEATLDLDGTKIKCDMASWTTRGVMTEIYYSKDVPCGGIVKTTSGGKDSVWLTGFHTEGTGDVKGAAGKVAAKSQLPRFWAALGNVAVLKISGTGRDATYQRREVTGVEETTTKYNIVTCDEHGQAEEGAKAMDREMTKEAWDADYAKPTETGVTLKVAGGEFKCDVYKTKDEDSGKETTEWVSEGAPVKKVIKTETSETVLELVSIEWQ